jgi:hypothetical protein
MIAECTKKSTTMIEKHRKVSRGFCNTTSVPNAAGCSVNRVAQSVESSPSYSCSYGFESRGSNCLFSCSEKNEHCVVLCNYLKSLQKNRVLKNENCVV